MRVCVPAGARWCVREKQNCSHMKIAELSKNASLGKTLVIAEKPSVAQDIVRALTPLAGKFDKHDE